MFINPESFVPPEGLPDRIDPFTGTAGGTPERLHMSHQKQLAMSKSLTRARNSMINVTEEQLPRTTAF